jgi:hypothetical protein
MQAQLTAAMPAHDAETDAVLLYSDIALSVQANGRIQRQERNVYRILRPEGSKLALVRVDFGAQNRVTRLRGWCIPASGKPFEVTEKDAIESALVGVLHGELVSDLRSKLLQIPAAIPGSLIGFEIAEELQPYQLAVDWMLGETVPVREAHYSLELPPGWQYKATWLNRPEEAPTLAGPTHWQWVARDLPAIRPEQQMPPLTAIAQRLVISLLPPSGREPGFQNWSELGTWYLHLTSGRRDAGAEIKRKAADLAAAQATVLGKMQALASFVQSDIRYVAIELGIGGLQPHTASEVFAHRYGDCKDKVTLLSAMLKEIGIDSHYVAVNSVRGAISDSTPANLGFNHMILAIQLPAGVDDPTLLAVLAHAKLGRLLLFDPTNTYVPLGSLAGSLQAGYGLLVAPDGGELIRLPQLPPGSNGLQRTAHLQLDDTGMLQGEVSEVRLGDIAADERYTVDTAAQDSDRIRSVESRLASSLATFRVTKASINNLHAPSRPLEWRYSIEVERYAKPNGDLLTVRPRVVGSKSSGLLETRDPRRYEIEFEGPRRDTDEFEITLPEGYTVDALPPPLDEDRSFAAYHSRTDLSGRTLTYRRTFEIKNLSVPAAEADQLKEFYRRINYDERVSAVLKRAPR